MLGRFIARRLLYMVILLVAMSVVSFIIIQLPPGDYMESYIARLQAEGMQIDDSAIAALRKRYGLDQPPHIQFLTWAGRLLKGDMGRSFQYNRPVAELVFERVPMTVLVTLASLLVTYLIAVPIGIYSATHQYSLGDFVATAIGFVGIAMPNFLFALILMWALYKWFGLGIGGLFSQGMETAPWNWAKVVDLVKHLPAPLIVISVSGAAGLIRVLRGTLLDELGKQYVQSARAVGLPESRLLFKYPVRIAITPLISSIGWMLPSLVSGSTVVSIVLSLPTVGPLLFSSLTQQDMYLAGGIVMFLTFMTVVGVLLSDILLALVHPRIRFE